MDDGEIELKYDTNDTQGNLDRDWTHDPQNMSQTRHSFDKPGPGQCFYGSLLPLSSVWFYLSYYTHRDTSYSLYQLSGRLGTQQYVVCLSIISICLSNHFLLTFLIIIIILMHFLYILLFFNSWFHFEAMRKSSLIWPAVIHFIFL